VIVRRCDRRRSLVAYLADFAFAFTVRTPWSPRSSEWP